MGCETHKRTCAPRSLESIADFRHVTMLDVLPNQPDEIINNKDDLLDSILDKQQPDVVTSISPASRYWDVEPFSLASTS